ncbi:nuclear transport factor 2 family protein [Nocardia sp. NPDC046763]|uniref:nuclear transport factor 2 family protein n=1 Tax=Nocardia sp. NPDC046763 TaxID=3155256 RepID=UPI0033FCBD65
MTVPVPVADAALLADRRFFDALLASDRSELEEILDPEFLIVDVNAGGVTSREEFLEFIGSGAVRFSRIDTFPDEAIVRQFGITTAVVGRTSMAFTLPDGGVATIESRYTHLFATGVQGLLLVSAQGTAISAA